jgi:hypothetical protein
VGIIQSASMGFLHVDIFHSIKEMGLPEDKLNWFDRMLIRMKKKTNLTILYGVIILAFLGLLAFWIVVLVRYYHAKLGYKIVAAVFASETYKLTF